MSHFPWLTAIIVFPLLAALPIPFLPTKDSKILPKYTLAAAVIEMIGILYVFAGQKRNWECSEERKNNDGS